MYYKCTSQLACLCTNKDMSIKVKEVMSCINNCLHMQVCNVETLTALTTSTFKLQYRCSVS